ncbi:MAG: hypothetical protein VYA67_22045 [Actinomycetota bacterium]|nr:hypothetical protein [Actinomycetota bacterium]
MSQRPIAKHVKLGDHELVVDGQSFPWFVAPNVRVTKKQLYIVHVEIIPMDMATKESLTITCPSTAAQPPVIGDKPFPWCISDDGYRVAGRKRTTLSLGFLAEEFEDARTEPVEPATGGVRAEILVNGETKFDQQVVSLELHNHVLQNWPAADYNCMSVTCDVRRVHA